jgi:hypothetical protein
MSYVLRIIQAGAVYLRGLDRMPYVIYALCLMSYV